MLILSNDKSIFRKGRAHVYKQGGQIYETKRKTPSVECWSRTLMGRKPMLFSGFLGGGRVLFQSIFLWLIWRVWTPCRWSNINMQETALLMLVWPFIRADFSELNKINDTVSLNRHWLLLIFFVREKIRVLKEHTCFADFWFTEPRALGLKPMAVDPWVMLQALSSIDTVYSVQFYRLSWLLRRLALNDVDHYSHWQLNVTRQCLQVKLHL